MNRRMGFAGGLMAVAIVWAGCASPTAQLPQYVVSPERLAKTPPAPVQVAAGDQSSEVIADAVKVEPEKAVGYADLPTTMTQLYDGPPMELPLDQAVVETLANNRGIKVEAYTLRIAEYQVPVSKGIYDLMTSAMLGFSRVEEQTSPLGSQFPASRGRTRQAQLGLAQLLPSGATIQTAYNVARQSQVVTNQVLNLAGLSGINSLSDLAKVSLFNSVQDTQVDYQQRFSLGVTQPLLKGFGPMVTNAGIRIAQLERQGAAADFQTNIEQTLIQVIQTYWQLIGAIEQFKVNVVSWAAARDLLRNNTIKFREGAVARTDVLQAEAAAEARSNQVIVARQQVRELEDQLKRLIFLQEGSPVWHAEMRPTQPFAWREISVDLDQTIQAALERRPEVRRARSNIDQADLNAQVAKNNTLPQLNVFGNVDSNGLDSNYDKSWDTATDGKFSNYSVGVEWLYPLQNRSARYKLSQAKAYKLQSEEGWRDLNDQITQEVRKAVRDLRTAREQIDVTQSQVRAEEAKLADEKKRYEVGMSTAFEILTFQGDLATAQSAHLTAVINYNIAAAQLEKARGTLLDTYGIQVTGADLNPQEKPALMPVGLQ